jgi:hypothetical protein
MKYLIKREYSLSHIVSPKWRRSQVRKIATWVQLVRLTYIFKKIQRTVMRDDYEAWLYVQGFHKKKKLLNLYRTGGYV